MSKKLVEEAPYHPGYEDAGFKPTDKPITKLIEEAIKLADDIDEYAPNTNIAIMMRRLIDAICTPMSHEKAEELIDKHINAPFALVRAVEEHHRIKK